MPQRHHLVHRSAISSPPFIPVTSAPPELIHIQEHKWTIENRFNLTDEELSRACVLLDHARHQQYFAASPFRSNFKVGSSVYCGDGRLATGSNAEYGAGPRMAYDEGIHSEEVAIVNALNHHGRDTLVEMVALSSDAPTPSTSCGKCRSLLETYGQPEVIIVSAGTDTTATMWKLSDLLPRDISSLARFPAPHKEEPRLQSLLKAAEGSRHAGFIPFSESILGRSVAAISANGTVLSLPRVDSLAFYGTSSLRATISATLLSHPRAIEAVLISSRSGLPTGEDRQILFEFASLFGQADSLPVYLNKEGEESATISTPSALLPHGFGPADLGMNLNRS
jgi:cytidine deaminase